MKNSNPIWLVVLFMCSTAICATAQKQPVKVKNGYQIEIQTSGICEMCKYTLEKDLTYEKGVKEASFSLDTKVLSLTYHPDKTSPEVLRRRVTLLGYHADTLARDSLAYTKLPMCCKDGSHGTPIPQVPLKSTGGR